MADLPPTPPPPPDEEPAPAPAAPDAPVEPEEATPSDTVPDAANAEGGEVEPAPSEEPVEPEATEPDATEPEAAALAAAEPEAPAPASEEGDDEDLAAKPPPAPSKAPLAIPPPEGTEDEVPPPPPPPPAPAPAPTATPRTPPSVHRRRRAVVLLVAIALIGSLIALGRRGDHGPPHPKHWDPRVADLASFVERARGLRFRHPVSVRFLTPAAYTTASDKDTSNLDAQDRADLARSTAQLRALGVLSGKVDLVKALSAETDAGTLAFYSPTDQVVRVRGTTMTVGLRVTLVHELTHALQDQRFGLRKLIDVSDDSAAAARRGLAEGDAIRIEQDYVTSELSADQQHAYDAEQAQQLATSAQGTADVPDFVTASFATPYALGPGFVQTLYAEGGNAAVDRAFHEPPPSEQDLFDPATYLAGERPQAPGLDLHGVKVREQGTFGGPGWFLVLAERIDPTTAFDAALGWAGDRVGIYQQGRTTCTRIVFRGRTPRDEQRMRAALDAWVKALPGGKARRSTIGGHPAIDACDPGPSVDLHLTNRAVDVLILPNRWGLVVAQVAKDLGADGSRCFASRVLDGLTYQQLSQPNDAALTNALATRSVDAYATCSKQRA